MNRHDKSESGLSVVNEARKFVDLILDDIIFSAAGYMINEGDIEIPYNAIKVMKLLYKLIPLHR